MTVGLTRDENKICEMFDLNPHAYIEARERDRVQAVNREAPMSKEQEIAFCQMMNVDYEEFCKQKSGSSTAINHAVNRNIAMGPSIKIPTR